MDDDVLDDAVWWTSKLDECSRNVIVWLEWRWDGGQVHHGLLFVDAGSKYYLYFDPSDGAFTHRQVEKNRWTLLELLDRPTSTGNPKWRYDGVARQYGGPLLTLATANDATLRIPAAQTGPGGSVCGRCVDGGLVLRHALLCPTGDTRLRD